MLDDMQRSLPVDSRRFYLVGFSGTARFAWEMTTRLPGHRRRHHRRRRVGAGRYARGCARTLEVVAGVVRHHRHARHELRGAPDRSTPSWMPLGAVHHVERFDGGHQWPPTESAARSVEWLTLQAMRRGLRPRNSRGSIRSTERGSPRRPARLLATPRPRRASIGSSAPTSTVSRTSVPRPLAPGRARAGPPCAARQPSKRPSPSATRSEPGARRVRGRVDPRRRHRRSIRRANDSSWTRCAATRRAPTIRPRRSPPARAGTHFMQMSFYAPVSSSSQAVCNAATRSRSPDSSSRMTAGCASGRRARSHRRATRGALAALECAGASRQVSVEAIEADPLLAPLRSDPRYEAVVRRLKGG